jgi:AmmeMemoRadiSam system protein B
MFYPASPQELSRAVEGFLAAGPPPSAGSPAPKIVVAPHAGYMYSGAIAGRAYAALKPLAALVERVVLLGPAHRVWVRGLALPGDEWFRTPLGNVRVDAAAVALLKDLPQVCVNREAHFMEHSLEVHLPFLQKIFGVFGLVPLVVGEASPREVAEVMERLWGGPETVIVVSSDLSHYLSYRDAKTVDASTADAILALSGPIGREQACGGTVLNGLIELARSRRLEARLLDLRNSGDTAGDRSRVVGYGAFAFHEH